MISLRRLSILLLIFSLTMLTGLSFMYAQDTDAPMGTQWQLVSMAGTPVLEGTTITLALDDMGRFNGSGGCNPFGGSYSFNGSAIHFEAPISTMMACEDGIQQQELDYFAALQAATSFDMTEEQFTITYGAGEQLVFSALATPNGTEWQLISIDDSDVIEGSAITLAFSEDERAIGNTGCNAYGGSYYAIVGKITFSQLFSTRRFCAGEGIMEQEQSYLEALEAATDYAISEGQLIITYGEGKTMIFAQISVLVGSQWQLTSIGGASVETTSATTLIFGEENHASGTGGCNSYGARFIVNDNLITFDQIISTMIACEEGVMQQENAFFDALSEATDYELTDDQLTIMYGDGQQLVFTPMSAAEG
ncbi:MAG: META domain-containing protein [Anaerolineae bacterium]|nr:META domain-containing protein [Anaerolineae bacterium]